MRDPPILLWVMVTLIVAVLPGAVTFFLLLSIAWTHRPDLTTAVFVRMMFSEITGWIRRLKKIIYKADREDQEDRVDQEDQEFSGSGKEK